MVCALALLQAQLGRKLLVQALGVIGFEAFQSRNRQVLVVDQGHQRLSQAVQIPKSNLRLTRISVTALVVRVVANVTGVKAIQELKRTIVDGQTQQAHVVGVHHTVAKPHRLPVGQQSCRAL